jgi:hypothetical protein
VQEGKAAKRLLTVADHAMPDLAKAEKQPAKAGKKVEEVTKTGRGKNHLHPDSQAEGPHTTFRRSKTGDLAHHREWKPNPQNPYGWDQVKRVDLEGGGHTNPATKKEILTPHTHDRSVPGGLREARPDELPESIGR